jgi:hypothetical protein
VVACIHDGVPDRYIQVVYAEKGRVLFAEPKNIYLPTLDSQKKKKKKGKGRQEKKKKNEKRNSGEERLIQKLSPFPGPALSCIRIHPLHLQDALAFFFFLRCVFS